MFIILLAHTRGNTWTLWIPARFGFSDATEIFVFCSGFASALAFGAVFAKKSWRLGAARIVFRVWQVYWAHIGIFLATAIILFAIDHYGVGLEDRRYVTAPYVVPLFNQTGEALLGLFTLTYVPGLFDILPMYLVILAMVPMVMALHRFGGRIAVAAFVIGVWLASNLAGYAWSLRDEGVAAAGMPFLFELGQSLQWLNLPGSPFVDRTWFFNPFGWQIVFFTGFAFGMGWIPAPPVSRRLIWLALGVVLLSLPFAWFKIHGGLYLPGEWALAGWISETREWMAPMWAKTWLGLYRFVHFLAVAYLAWVAVGEGGRRLREGFATPRRARGIVLLGAIAVLIATVPYAYVDEIKWLAPSLDDWLVSWIPLVSGDRIGLLQLAHLAALIVVIWAMLGDRWRRFATRDAFLAVVPVIRKVGTQSLAVFMMSIPLAVVNAWLMDLAGRDVWTRAGINLWGFGVLIATAYLVAWFKSEPWRGPKPAPSKAHESEGRTAAHAGGARARA